MKLLGVTESYILGPTGMSKRGNVKDKNPKLSVYNFELGLGGEVRLEGDQLSLAAATTSKISKT